MDQEAIVQLYKGMRRIRRFEEEASKLCKDRQLDCKLFSYSNREAIAIGATSVIEVDDFLLSSYHCHGLFLARGGSMRELFAEILGLSGGCCGGNAGPLNIFDIEHRYIGGWSISGTQIPIAAGFAFAQSHHKVPNITLCFLTNADISNGLFHETLTLANSWKLPLVLVVQNQHTDTDSYKKKEKLYHSSLSDIKYDSIDGNDLFAVRGAVHTAITAARESHIASVIEAHTVSKNSRNQEDLQLDPLIILAKKLKAFGKEEAGKQIDLEIENEVQQAIRFVNASSTTTGINYGEI